MRVKVETFRDNAFYNNKNPFVRMNGVHRRIKQRGLCPKCSALTLTDTRATDSARRFQTCVICGWHGSPDETITYQEALKEHTVLVDGKLYLR